MMVEEAKGRAQRLQHAEYIGMFVGLDTSNSALLQGHCSYTRKSLPFSQYHPLRPNLTPMYV